METIAFIPLRGNSKSIQRKNIKLFCERPLVYWNLLALQQSLLYSKVVVATDNDEIDSVVRSFGFSKVSVYRRSDESATDTAPTEHVMLEFLKKELDERQLQLNDIFILVQATSPLTRQKDFEGSLALFRQGDFDSVLSCVRFKRFLWTEDGIPKNYDYRNRPRRQEFKGDFMENGALYISKVSSIISSGNRLSGKIGIYEMPEYTYVEIDEEIDWLLAETLMQKHSSEYKLPLSKQKIKIVLTDVDGVLTDAGMYYSETGDELKKFNTKDGMAFKVLRNRGIKTGFVTSETTKIVSNRAKKLNIDFLFQGTNSDEKLMKVIDLCRMESISIEEVAYIGDDINCCQLLKEVGYAGCPSDAVAEVKSIRGINIISKKGGEGVFREFTEKLMKEGLLYP